MNVGSSASLCLHVGGDDKPPWRVMARISQHTQSTSTAVATAKCLLMVQDSSKGTQPNAFAGSGAGWAGRACAGTAGTCSWKGLFPAGNGQEVHPAVLPAGVGGAVPPRHTPSSQHEPGGPGGPGGTPTLSLETRQVTPFTFSG